MYGIFREDHYQIVNIVTEQPYLLGGGKHLSVILNKAEEPKTILLNTSTARDLQYNTLLSFPTAMQIASALGNGSPASV